ncbi:MAG: radical SAM family heme chaperone HemW [Chitinivibrionales bacterium]|nr:radical SAM family heme chaperone HemW [Chitinivibrionales bacterium]
MKPPSSYSLYIHFPFCRKKCRYCDFYSLSCRNLSDAVKRNRMEHYMSACIKELVWSQTIHGLGDVSVSSIYCGGGTPSMIDADLWLDFSTQIRSIIKPTRTCEWTIECNPDSFTAEKARAWASTGVNRLSIGVQALQERLLRFSGRPHTARHAQEVLETNILEQFLSVGVDIMYGLPGQTIADLTDTLQSIIQNRVIKHLSMYELTIAAATPFGRHCKHIPLPDEEELTEMTECIGKTAADAGFLRYEVSNFARMNHECIHNKTYWSHQPYLGIGAAAHSFMNSVRWANVANLDAYAERVERSGTAIETSEQISGKTKATEMIFLRLRTTEGLDELLFEQCGIGSFYDGLRKQFLDRLLTEGHIVYNRPHWSLTDKGIRCADAISRKLF